MPPTEMQDQVSRNPSGTRRNSRSCFTISCGPDGGLESRDLPGEVACVVHSDPFCDPSYFPPPTGGWWRPAWTCQHSHKSLALPSGDARRDPFGPGAGWHLWHVHSCPARWPLLPQRLRTGV